MKDGVYKYVSEKFATLREEFNFVGDNNVAPHDKVQMAAKAALPYIKPFTGITGWAKLKAGSLAAHTALKFLKPEHYEEISKAIRNISRAEIEKAVSDFVSDGATEENALKSAKGLKEFLDAFPEETQISSARAFDEALPPALKSLIYELLEYDASLPVEDRVREWRKEIKNTSTEDLAKKMLANAQNAHTDVLTDAIHDMTRKCTPEVLEKAIEHIKAELTIGKINALASTGIAFADEFCTAATNKKLASVANSKKGASFAVALRDVLTIGEDAVLNSGLSPDKSPVEVFRSLRKTQEQPPAAPGKGRKPKL
jgi:hypothetical protein